MCTKQKAAIAIERVSKRVCVYLKSMYIQSWTCIVLEWREQLSSERTATYQSPTEGERKQP